MKLSLQGLHPTPAYPRRIYTLSHVGEYEPTRREFYQSQLICGTNRGGLTHADEVHGTAHHLHGIATCVEKFWIFSFCRLRVQRIERSPRGNLFHGPE